MKQVAEEVFVQKETRMSDLIGNFDFDQGDCTLNIQEEESFEETKDVDNSMYRESIVSEPSS